MGISGQDGLAEMRGFVDEYEMSGFDHVADVRGEIWRAFEITAQPSYVFISDTGVITRHIGALEADELTAQIEALIAPQ